MNSLKSLILLMLRHGRRECHSQLTDLLYYSFVSSIEDVLQQWGLTASTYSVRRHCSALQPFCYVYRPILVTGRSTGNLRNSLTLDIILL